MLRHNLLGNAPPSLLGETDLKSLISEIRHQRHVAITWLVIAIIFVCYAAGWYLIIFPSWRSAIGTLLIAEAMILSWYLGHDCAHLLAFRGRNNNIVLGETLSWITGGAFFPFKDYRRDHLRHHAEQIDIIGVDLQQTIQSFPASGRALVLGLEAIYVPAIYFVVKIAGVAGELSQSGGNRARALGVLIAYILFYGTVLLFCPFALLCYFVAVSIRIHCIRFVDAFQHTYDHVDGRERVPPRKRDYDQRNTFSFPVARRFKFLNLLILNFGFHNAHHAAPNCPWYNLPKIHSSLQLPGKTAEGGKICAVTDKISFGTLIKSYHRKRIERILIADVGSPYGPDDQFSMQAFRGAFTDNLLG